MKMKLTYRVGLIALVAVVLIFVAGCSREVASPIPLDLTKAAVLRQLPEAPLGFIVWDMRIPAYDRFRKSPWKQGSVTDLMNQIQNSGVPVRGLAFKDLFETLEDSELFKFRKEQPPAAYQGVAYIELPNPQELPTVAACFVGAPDADFSKPFDALRTRLQELKFEIKDESIDEFSGFSIAPGPERQGGNVHERTFFALKPGGFTIASNTKGVKQCLKKPEGTGPGLIESPRFKAGMKSLSGSKDQFVLGFLDFRRAFDTAEKMAGQVAQPLPVSLQMVPIDVLTYRRSMTEGLSDSIALTIPKDIEPLPVVKRLISSGSPAESMEMVPSGTVVALRVHGDILKLAKSELAQSIPDAERWKQELALVERVSDFSLALRQSPNAYTPMPELLFAFRCKDSAVFRDQLRKSLTDLRNKNGLPISGWQEKEFEGVKVITAQGLMGLGVSLAALDQGVVVATSEAAIQAAIKTAKGSDSGVLGDYPAGARQLLDKSSSFASLLINFHGLSDLVAGFRGSLAAFAPGDTPDLTSELDELRVMGRGVFTLGSTQDSWKIESSLSPVAEAK